MMSSLTSNKCLWLWIKIDKVSMKNIDEEENKCVENVFGI
jgi:hypothetical protein